MSITDELRAWADTFSSVWIERDGSLMYTTNGAPPSSYSMSVKSYICEIADRIDAAHRSALEKLAAQLDESGALPMTDENMAEHGWVRGPLDANGEMWRCGDMSDSNWGVIEGIAYENGRWLISGHDTSAPWIPADSISHHHVPTVEDVLREFADEVQRCCDTADTIAEYAARLRLAGGDE